MNETREIQMAILMADLTGYTAMTEVHGAETALKTVDRYVCLAGKALYGSARILERAGDQLVIVSPRVCDLGATTIRLVQLCAAEPEFLQIHAGLHYGPVIEKDGSYFGTAMNLTSRIAAKAGKGKILCTEDFMEQAAGCAALEFMTCMEVGLKNIRRPVRVAELLLNTGSGGACTLIDPVCQMQVTATSGFTLFRNGTTYHFCSAECLDIFSTNPN